LFLLSFGEVNFSLRFGKNVLKAIFLNKVALGNFKGLSQDGVQADFAKKSPRLFL
jgi:hypothetical protein